MKLIWVKIIRVKLLGVKMVRVKMVKVKLARVKMIRVKLARVKRVKVKLLRGEFYSIKIDFKSVHVNFKKMKCSKYLNIGGFLTNLLHQIHQHNRKDRHKVYSYM